MEPGISTYSIVTQDISLICTYQGKGIGLLVLVDSTYHYAYISSLSTSSSRTFLRKLFLECASRLDAFSGYHLET